MKQDFKYIQPQSLKSASTQLKNSTSVAYAGGTDLLGLIKDDIISPETLVNLKLINGLSGIKHVRGKGFFIGAMTKISELAEDDLIQKELTVLAEAAKQVASPQLRNVGTIAGNLCQRPRCWYFRGDYHCLRKGGDSCFAYDGENKYHCIIGGDSCFIVHPSDIAVALRALDATISIYSDGKSKTVSVHDFFVLPEVDDRRENILQQGEIITEIFIPELPQKTISTYYKHRQRRSWDFAVVSIAAVITKSNRGVASGKLTFGGVAPIPWVEEKLNSAMSNFEINDETLQRLSQLSFSDADPLAQNGYKLPLVRNLIRKVLRESIAKV